MLNFVIQAFDLSVPFVQKHFVTTDDLFHWCIQRIVSEHLPYAEHILDPRELSKD